MMKIDINAYTLFALLTLLGVADATASSLESVAGAVGGQSSCSTSGSRPPISTLFGSYFQIGTTGNGISDCGLQGSIQDRTATQGPLTTTSSVNTTVGGGTYTGSSSATSNFGALSVASHGQMLGVTRPGGVNQSGGFSIFNDQLTFKSSTQANGGLGKVVYTFTIGGGLTTPVPTPPFSSTNIANLVIQQGSFFQGNIFTARTASTETGTILGNPSYPGFTTALGTVQGSGQFSSASIPFVWGESVNLTVGLAAVGFPATGATVDAFLNAVLSGIKVFDASDNLLNDFSITAASGSVYLASGVSSVQIPPAFSAFGLGPRVPDPIPTVITKGNVLIGLKTVAKGYVMPVTATFAPKDKNHLFVVEQNGKIWSVQVSGNQSPEGGGKRLFANLGAFGLNLGCFGINYDERGLFGLAFHPNYRKNGLLYTYQSQPYLGTAKLGADQCDSSVPDHDNVVTEWKVKNPGLNNAKIDISSARELLRVDHPQFNHNGGELRFDPDGMLYVSIGDGGNADDQGTGHTAPDGNAQDLTNLHGKILRIDPLSGSASPGYRIPADNPFVSTAGARGEIWAYGFRNPYKMSFDVSTGQLYVADVGQNDVEEIDIVQRGGNYGWPVKEGTFAFDQNGTVDGFVTADIISGFVDPIAEYDHCVHPAALVEACPKKEGGAIVGKAKLGMSVLGIGEDARGELYVLGKSGAAPGNIGITDPSNMSGVVRKLTAHKSSGSSGKGTANPKTTNPKPSDPY
jgi:glucose/arabinose dehydrogenase